MGAFPALPLGRRAVRARLLIVYRVDPGVLGRLLPTDLRPRLVHGMAVGAACYTRLGAPSLLPSRAQGSDHLAYRFAVERADGRAATWIARRETSSWLEARCGSKLLRGEYGRSSFQMKEDAFAVELAVAGERGEEFYLRGEASGEANSALFDSERAFEEFFERGRVEPYDVFAPEADELDLDKNFAPEPLAVFEARSAFLAEAPFVGAAELDSAWKLVTRRLAGTRSGRLARFRPLPEAGTSTSPLPTI